MQNNITVITIPAHTSSLTQALDCVPNGTFKTVLWKVYAHLLNAFLSESSVVSRFESLLVSYVEAHPSITVSSTPPTHLPACPQTVPPENLSKFQQEVQTQVQILKEIDNSDFALRVQDRDSSILIPLPKQPPAFKFNGKYYHGLKNAVANRLRLAAAIPDALAEAIKSSSARNGFEKSKCTFLQAKFDPTIPTEVPLNANASKDNVPNIGGRVITTPQILQDVLLFEDRMKQPKKDGDAQLGPSSSSPDSESSEHIAEYRTIILNEKQRIVFDDVESSSDDEDTEDEEEDLTFIEKEDNTMDKALI